METVVRGAALSLKDESNPSNLPVDPFVLEVRNEMVWMECEDSTTHLIPLAVAEEAYKQVDLLEESDVDPEFKEKWCTALGKKIRLMSWLI